MIESGHICRYICGYARFTATKKLLKERISKKVLTNPYESAIIKA